MDAFKLPFELDVGRLAEDARRLERFAYSPQPGPSHNGEWTGIALHSAGGVQSAAPSFPSLSPYMFTPEADHAPYLKAVLESLPFPLQVVRVLKLPPGGVIREHLDFETNFQFGLVRLHVPLRTNAAVEFLIAGRRYDMQVGELWYGDFSQLHSVANHGGEARLHAVIDAEVNDELLALLAPEHVIRQLALGPCSKHRPGVRRAGDLRSFECRFFVPGTVLPLLVLGRLAELARGAAAEVRWGAGELVLVLAGEPRCKLVRLADEEFGLLGFPSGCLLRLRRQNGAVVSATLVVRGVQRDLVAARVGVVRGERIAEREIEFNLAGAAAADKGARVRLADEQSSLFKRPPYSEDGAWRRVHLRALVADLTRHHYERCDDYRSILNGLNVDPTADKELAELPFLPAGLFKRLDLVSVAPSAVYRVLTSSGTSRAARSRVFLDRETSVLQMRALASIVAHFVGADRLPVLIVDAAREPEGDRAGYAARLVAIQGFSLFGAATPAFALTPDMRPDLARIEAFLQAAGERRFLVFGFTYVIWRHLLEHLERHDRRLNLANAVLVHGGGWKRLAGEHVNDAAFRALARERAGLTRVHEYYGMVEQPGSIYMQCERGFLHCSNFSEILVRRLGDLSVADRGEPGLLQTISILPRSYPGHNILTEDMGVQHGEDDCGCGRRGKFFRVLGRLPTAEARGCGDTYVADP